MTTEFFGYYTPGPYERDARVLIESLDALGLRHNIRAVPSRGSWQANTQLKAEIVHDTLASGDPGRRWCYIDVDSIIIHHPTLLDSIDADIAAVMFRGSILLSGVVMFQDNARTLACVNRWIELNRLYPERLPDGREAWDQRTLQMAIAETGVKFAALPPEYNYMPGLSQREYPGINPVILATRGALKYQDGAL